MGVAVVGSPISSGQAPSGATTVTFNVTVPTGSTWLHVQENNAQGSGGVTPTGVTYNGVALTMVPSSSIIASYFESSQWYLANPPTNTSYVLSFTYAVGRNYFGASAIGLSGVNSSTPYGTAVKNASATTIAGATLTVPASTANDLLLATALVYGTGVTPGGGTNLWTATNINSAISASGDDDPGGTTGNFTWTATGTTNTVWTASGVAVLGAGGGGGTSVTPIGQAWIG